MAQSLATREVELQVAQEAGIDRPRIGAFHLRLHARRLQVGSGWKWAGLAATCAACSATLFLFDPAKASFYPPCPFYLLTGFYCPGCGTARALFQLLHGNLPGALALNPLAMVGLPFIVYVLGCYLLRWTNGRALPGWFLSAKVNIVVLGIINAYWLLRNIPLYPFNLLAPH